MIKNYYLRHSRIYAITLNALVYLALLFAIFGHAIININTSYIGIEGDSSYYIWITKWFSQLFSRENIFHITNVFYPIGIDISAGWEGSILFYIGGFLNIFFSEAAAYNLLIFIPLILNWTSIYFVFYKLSNRMGWAGLFSTLFCTSSFFIARSLGHPSYLYFFHIPLLFYFLQDDWLRKLDFKKSLFLIMVYALIAITSWYYFIFAMIITLIFMIDFIIKNGKTDFAIYKKIALTYAGILVLVIILNFPIFKAFFWGSQYFFPYPFKMNNEEPNLQNSMHLIEYLKPSTLNFLYSNLAAWRVGNIEKILFPGLAYYPLLIISVLIILAKKSYRKYCSAIIIGLLFIIFSIGNHSLLPLYNALTSLPLASSLHAPGRFGIISIFAGWILIVQASRHFKGRVFGAILIVFISLQIYEITKFQVPFQDFENINILKSLTSNKTSPVLELPIRPNLSNTLLIPAVSNRSVFSGYPQHTTYSPQLNYYVLNNVFASLGQEENIATDVTAELSAAESAIYFRWKFGVEDVVINKQFPLSLKTVGILKFLNLAKENNNYAIYQYEQIPSFENNQPIKIVTGKGIGQLTKKGRNIAEKAEIDILNFTTKPHKIKLHLKTEGIMPETNYFIDNNNIENGIAFLANPGLNTLTIDTTQKCTIQGADCVTGFISKIDYSIEK